MSKIPVYRSEDEEVEETPGGGLSNEVIDSITQSYFDLKTKELDCAERMTSAFLNLLKFGIETMREEWRLERNFRQQADKRDYEHRERQAVRNHEQARWQHEENQNPPERKSAKDAPKVRKTSLAAKSGKGSVRKTKSGS